MFPISHWYYIPIWLKTFFFLYFENIIKELLLTGCSPIISGGPTKPSRAQKYGLLYAFFSFLLDPCGRYGRFYGVTARSYRPLTVTSGPFVTSILHLK